MNRCIDTETPGNTHKLLSDSEKEKCTCFHTYSKTVWNYSLQSESSGTPLDFRSVLHFTCNQPVYDTQTDGQIEQNTQTHSLTHSNWGGSRTHLHLLEGRQHAGLNDNKQHPDYMTGQRSAGFCWRAAT